MPKCYSEHEKSFIKKRLKEEAGDCLARYGIKGTTVDELVRRVKIPKGTFYLFYKSKELLVFDVLMEQHERIEKELTASLSALQNNDITCDGLTDLIFGFFKYTDENPLFRLLTSGELEILARKLPEEFLENHFMEDGHMIENVISILPGVRSVDIQSFASAFRSLFMSMLASRKMNDEKSDEALKLLIRGLVIQMIP